LADTGNNVFRNLAWGLPELLGQFKSQRQRVLTHLHLRWLLDDNVWLVYVVGALQKLAHVLREAALQSSVQGSSLNC
jgi:hypothetical protein